SARTRQQIADHQRRAHARKALRHLLQEAFHPWPARYERARGQAFGAAGRQRLRMTAMMTEKAPGKAVLDEPGSAARALKAMATGAAQGQRRVAPAIEE